MNLTAVLFNFPNAICSCAKQTRTPLVDAYGCDYTYIFQHQLQNKSQAHTQFATLMFSKHLRRRVMSHRHRQILLPTWLKYQKRLI